jgi:branched-chain amino acid transport system permease protein
MGVDTKKVKVYAFTVSALIGGLGGALYAHHVMLVAPTMMALTEMAMILAMTIIGGYGSFSGAVIGPFLVWPITAFLLTITPVGGLPFIILALVMILIQLVAPGGIARYAHLP